MAKRALIVFASVEGQTAKIAAYMRSKLEEKGWDVEYNQLGKELPTFPRIVDQNLVIVGSPIHMGSYEKLVSKFCAQHHFELNAVPSAFFTVCLAASNVSNKKQHDQVSALAQTFLESADWHPHLVGLFGGALAYSKYNLPKRWVMQLIARANNGKRS